ncbi:MAG: RNA methyltransferase [Eubacterium sp.]|nr:RNA methyltransferase [Eubacterium sp.]
MKKEKITSPVNRQMKRIVQLNKKAKAREKERIFVAEGIKMFSEAPKAWIEKVYVSESFCRQLEKDAYEHFAGYDWELVADPVFHAVCDTKTPQGILTTFHMPEYTLQDLIKRAEPGLLLIENIQDPGNLGTMFRTAEGAGIDGIIMSADTVDIFHPKTIRSTMGSVFRMPFYITEDLVGAISLLQKEGICIYAASLEDSCLYDEPDYTAGYGFLIGNEGSGLCPDTVRRADRSIHIPMAGELESLNAAMAAAVLMYEADRQRRQKK